MLSNLKRLFLLLTIGTLMTGALTSCKDDDETTPAKSIAEIVNTDANFSLLKELMTKAGLSTALSSGTFTVFAPDNAAFAASGITSATISGLSQAQAVNILTYHALTARVASSAVPASDTVVSLQGEYIFASKNANGVFVNGVKVKTADVSASNGIIHVISSVLAVPENTIADIAIATPDLSLLVAAVTRAGLVSAISDPAKFTVFAPTNAAFTAAGFPTEASINAAPVDAVAAIVKAHIIPTNVFASDLIAGATANTLQTGVSLTIATTPPSVKITGSANPASIINVSGNLYNILATNGVVHVIDRVLLP